MRDTARYQFYRRNRGKNGIAIDEFDTRPDSADIAFSMTSSVSLHKVDRIACLESYIVRTPGAACFAQGGRFMATARDSGETLVSVKEGNVFLHPADVEILPRSRRGRKMDKKIAELMDWLPYNAPTAESGVEVVIGRVTVEAPRKGISRFDEELKRALWLKKARPADIARFAESAKAYRKSIQENIRGSMPLSSTAALIIDWLDRLPALPISRLKATSPSEDG